MHITVTCEHEDCTERHTEIVTGDHPTPKQVRERLIQDGWQCLTYTMSFADAEEWYCPAHHKVARCFERTDEDAVLTRESVYTLPISMEEITREPVT